MKKLLAISLAAAAFAALHAAEETRNKGGIMAETGALNSNVRITVWGIRLQELESRFCLF